MDKLRETAPDPHVFRDLQVDLGEASHGETQSRNIQHGIAKESRQSRLAKERIQSSRTELFCNNSRGGLDHLTPAELPESINESPHIPVEEVADGRQGNTSNAREPEKQSDRASQSSYSISHQRILQRALAMQNENKTFERGNFKSLQGSEQPAKRMQRPLNPTATVDDIQDNDRASEQSKRLSQQSSQLG